MSEAIPTQIHAAGEATGFIPAPGDKGKPITVIGTNSIRAGFDASPVGCVLTSPTHIYPGPVGVDIKCSMSFLQMDLPAAQVADKTVRRALINAIVERTPTGPGRGQRSAKLAKWAKRSVHHSGIESATCDGPRRLRQAFAAVEASSVFPGRRHSFYRQRPAQIRFGQCRPSAPVQPDSADEGNAGGSLQRFTRPFRRDGFRGLWTHCHGLGGSGSWLSI